MKLSFQYNPAREYDNFRAAFASKNHRKASPRQREFYAKYKRLTPANVKVFSRTSMNEHDLAPTAILREIRQRWGKAEKRFFLRADRIWGQPLGGSRMTVYLTVHDRCSYNFERGYFFIHTNTRAVTKTIMHELWHWYFYESVGKALKRLYGPTVFNDIKESLTVLLNEEFAGLMPGVQDRGYPQHKRMRTAILRTYRRTKDIYTTIQRTLPTST